MRFECAELNVLKVGAIVKQCDNRSKNDCIPARLAQISQGFCCVSALLAKDVREFVCPQAKPPDDPIYLLDARRNPVAGYG